MSQQQSPKQYPFVHSAFHDNNQRLAAEIRKAEAKGHEFCECPSGKHHDDCLNVDRGTGTTLSQRSFGGPDYEGDSNTRRGQEGEFARHNE